MGTELELRTEALPAFERNGLMCYRRILPFSGTEHADRCVGRRQRARLRCVPGWPGCGPAALHGGHRRRAVDGLGHGQAHPRPVAD